MIKSSLPSSGVDKQGAYRVRTRTRTDLLSRKCIIFLKQDPAFIHFMNATDDIDIAIPCVRLFVHDTPEYCVKTAKRM